MLVDVEVTNHSRTTDAGNICPTTNEVSHFDHSVEINMALKVESDHVISAVEYGPLNDDFRTIF